MTYRSVETPHYHIWTDALLGRRLARESPNEWDRGTYVRWTVASAWTAFEATCEHLTGVSGLGMRFKEKLNAAFEENGIPRPDWGSGLWQEVLEIYALRKDYVHPAVPQDRLFAPVHEAEQAIEVLRRAIKDVYRRTGVQPADWPDDDDDLLDPRGTIANATVIRGGADRETGIRICYVMLGKEYESEVAPADTDYAPLMDDLLRRIRVPISAVRAYRGGVLLDEVTVRMRKS